MGTKRHVSGQPLKKSFFFIFANPEVENLVYDQNPKFKFLDENHMLASIKRRNNTEIQQKNKQTNKKNQTNKQYFK